jgi:hypothetical protein
MRSELQRERKMEYAMRSIPAAMTWESLARSPWGLMAASLAGIGLPAIILTALQLEGPVSGHDSPMPVLHIVFVHINAVLFGSAVYLAQGPVAQLYAYPIRTSAIVAWRWLPAMALMAVQTAANIALLNVIFNLDWPLWGPALAVAVLFAAVEAAMWLTDKSIGWLVVALTVVGFVLGLWFKSRYGPAFSEPQRFWLRVTAAECFTMLAMIAAAYGVAVAAVARNRRGDPPLSLGIVDRLRRLCRPGLLLPPPLPTPVRAQQWFEWRRKGRLMPAAVLLGVVIGLTVWAIFNRNAVDLFFGLLGGGGMLWAIGIIGGLVMGNAGPHDASYAMGHFLATRPITDAQLARITLRTAAQSLLLAWCAWAVPLLIAYLAVLAAGDSPALSSPDTQNGWYLSSTLIGPWIMLGTLTSLGLAGWPKWMLRILCCLGVTCVALMVCAELSLTPGAQSLLRRALLTTLGGLFLLGTAWLYTAAWRRGLLQPRSIWAAGGAWAAGTALLVLDWPLNEEPLLCGYVFFAGLLALAVAPLAAAPLAVSANRHR